MVMEPTTPSKTPLAMTRPRSRPRVKVIKQRARKPAMVVAELPITELKVSLMACSIDLDGSWEMERRSRYECQRKME